MSVRTMDEDNNDDEPMKGLLERATQSKYAPIYHGWQYAKSLPTSPFGGKRKCTDD